MMCSPVSFKALGRLRVLVGGEPVALGSVKRQVLVALLLCHANQPVAPDVLQQAMWTEHPPGSKRNNLYWHVHQWRRSLREPGRLRTRGGNYQFTVRAGELDIDGFVSLREAGVRAFDENEWRTASKLLAEADSLWRGEAFEGLTSVPELGGESNRLAELRFGAMELRYDAELQLGRHRETVSGLASLVTAHPFREGLRAKLMLALYRCGRQADALQVYRQGRERSIDELGLEPGSELVKLERAILNQRPELDPPHPPVAVSGSSSRQPAPAELPPEPSAFTARQEDREQLRATVQRCTGTPHGPVIVTGMVGVGKSALVNHVAHSLKDSFPDGQLYADLRASGGAGRQPPREVLARLLRSLGATGTLRGGTDELAARFRTVSRGRRILIVLDNADSAAQVEAILPNEPLCTVLVSSRHRLSSLPDARRHRIDVLTETESVSLVTRLLGPRTTPPVRSVTTLARLCGHHPFALTLAAGRLNAQPNLRLDRFVDRLARPQSRLLDELELDGRSLRASLDDCCRHLTADADQLLQLLGLADKPSLSVASAVVLSGADACQADRALTRLVDHGLIAPGGRDGYLIHVLVRLFARERARDEMTVTSRRQARVRWNRLPAAGLRARHRVG